MTTYAVSPDGILEIAEHEGIVIGPYLDSKDVWTYGVGHTAAAGGLVPAKMDRVDTRGWSDKIVMQVMVDALKVFDDDLDSYESRVNSAVKVPLKQHQFDALVSFDFNTGGIYEAKLTEFLNAGDYDEAAARFMGWTKPKEIKDRREDEMMLFRTGSYAANGSSIAVYDALPDGSIRWRARIDSQELAAIMGMAGTKRRTRVKKLSRLWDFLRGLFPAHKRGTS